MSWREILMIGTAPEGKGGVASVVGVYMAHGLQQRFPLRYISTHREGSRLAKLWCSVSALLRIVALLLSGRVAVLHAHVSSNASFKRKSVYLALARAFGVSTVFHLHGGAFDKFTDQSASPRLRRWIVHSLQRSTRVVALSESWVQYLSRIAPGVKVRAIANPVFMPALPEGRADPEEQRGRLVFLGRAEHNKGVFDLLQALQLLREQRPDVRLAIGGDGNLEALRAEVHRLGLDAQVEVLGWVVGEAKLQQLRRAEVFVLPSYSEGLPMSMLEAMAFGKAVVVTPVGGIPEAVQHEQQGLLVQPGQPRELADALLRLLQDGELRLRLGQQARQRVAERFGVERVLGQVADLYRELGIEELRT